jgi:hypothetical protein
MILFSLCIVNGELKAELYLDLVAKAGWRDFRCLVSWKADNLDKPFMRWDKPAGMASQFLDIGRAKRDLSSGLRRDKGGIAHDFSLGCGGQN